MTTPAVTYDHVADRVGSLLSVPAERIRPETTLRELLSDSLLMVEVAIDLQEEYEVILTQDDIQSIHTFGDLVTLLQSRQ